MTCAIGYASPSDPRLSPPDVPEFDPEPYVQDLIASPTFCEEAIGNAAARILAAYLAKEHLPHVLDCVIEEYAQEVIDRAINERRSLEREGEACSRVIRMYTRHDPRRAA